VTAGTGQQNTRVVETNDHVAWLAWSLAALFVAMFVVGAALTLSSLSVGAATQPSTSSTWGTAGSLSGLVIFLPFLAFPLVGALIASRRPKNPIGWICLAAGLFWMSIVVEASIPGSASYPVTIDALLQWT
jgi:MFS-type transporter involved in bile tolerance (Atg22 family)